MHDETRCEKCKEKIDGSAVAQESFGDLLYYHEECFKGRVLGCLSSNYETEVVA